MKKIIAVLLSLMVLTGTVSPMITLAYNFDVLPIDGFDQSDDSLEMWFMWLPMNTSEKNTYHELLETNFGRTFHDMIIPFNIGRIEGSEYDSLIQRYGLSQLSVIYKLNEIQQTFNAAYNTDIDMAKLDGITIDGGEAFVHIIDNYFIVEQSPHGTESNPNPKRGHRLDDGSAYWIWYYQDKWNTNDYIYTIISYKNIAGYNVRAIDYISFTPPSDDILNNYNVKSSQIKVTLNGNEVYFDQVPIIQNGRTLVPIRAICEAMECDVEWNGQDNSVMVYKDGNMAIKMYIGLNEMWTYSNPNMLLDTAPQIINGRTMVPIRAISESMGAKVFWRADSKTVDILYNSQYSG